MLAQLQLKLEMSETETTEEKSEERSGKLSSFESRKPRSKPPFKLCFVLREELGRSYILPSRPKKAPCEYQTIEVLFYILSTNS